LGTRQQHEGRAANLASFILDKKEEILAEWITAVRRLPSPARDLPRPALLDSLPRLLESIAEAIGTRRDGGGTRRRRLVGEHAVQRLDRGIELAEVVAEYSILRDTILHLWERAAAPASLLAATRVLHRAIDDCVATSIEQFTEVHDRAARALDRLASATLESRDLDDLLSRLLFVLLETMPAIDTAAILLREGDRLRVRAAAGLERDVETGWSVAIGEGFAGRIAAERRPLALRSAADDPLVDSRVLRDKRVRGLYGVPLLQDSHVIGVAQIGSLTAYEFADHDRRILDVLAARATAAIHQQTLRRAADRRTAQLSAVIESIADAIFIADAHGIKIANRRALELMGLSSAEQLPVPYPELIARMHPRDVETGRALADTETGFARALRGETSVNQIIVRRPDGEERILRTAVSPIEIGGRIELVVSVATDITAAKQYERERTELLERERDARARAERAESGQRFLYEATAILTSSLDYEETLERVTRLAVPELGDWCTVDLIGPDGRIRNFAVAHTDPAKAAVARRLTSKYPTDPNAKIGIPAVIRTGRPEIGRKITDELLVRVARDAEHLRMLRELGLASYLIVPLSARGRVFGTLSLACSDARRRYGPAELELAEHLGRRAGLAIDNARLYRESQDAIRAREQVLAIVSHDLRNPLGAVNMSAQVIQDHARELDDERLARQAERIKRSSARMEHLITDVLDMASIRAGRFAVERRQEHAESLVHDAIEQHEPLARAKGIQLTADAQIDDARILCDRERVLQVFANVIGNAIKFCSDGDAITVRARRADEAVRFEVADTGPGIAPDELDHVFDAYWSAPAHMRKGTGLGLFIARGIVEAHGGWMGVDSALGRGTTFWFTLPVA